MTKKSTKRALLTSLLSLLVCVSMLIGTTFAWFTDSVSSTNNIIKSGNLDVELEYSTDMANWTKVTSETNIFKADALWEPGYTEVVYLRVSNKGNLALKYNLGVNIASETAGINKAGKNFLLSQFIEYGVIEDVTEKYAQRGVARAAVTDAVKLNSAVAKEGSLLAKKATDADYPSKVLALVVYMPESVGNEANHNGTAPVINLGLNLMATQFTYESDSFGSNYDAGAPWTGKIGTVPQADADKVITITSPEELAALAVEVNGGNSYAGYTVKLGNDLDLNNLPWTTIGTGSNGFSATFDGQNHTVYNLNVTAEDHAGLFGYAAGGGNFKNLTVENAVVNAHNYAGAILGRGYTVIDNCHVKNVTVTATPYLDSKGVYDGGAKAGGIVGQMMEGGTKVTNCSATDVEIYAFRDLGGVVGMVHDNNSASNNTATNVTLGYLLFDKITADKNENAGAIYGRVNASATVSPAKDSQENQAFTLVYAVYDVNSLTSLANYVNNDGNTFEGKTVVMIDDIDLQNMAWTPIGRTGSTSTDFTYAFRGTFDGKGHTVSNLSVSNTGWAGVFGLAYKSDIKNINVNGVSIESNRMAGSVVGQLYGNLYNCHVSNANIVVVPNATGNTYDNGDKVGGIVGWIGDNNNNRTLTGCSVTNLTIKAYRDIGGLAGYAAYSTTISNNTVKNISLTADQTINFYEDRDANANAFWGKNSVNGSTGVIASNNKEENVSISVIKNDSVSD